MVNASFYRTMQNHDACMYNFCVCSSQCMFCQMNVYAVLYVCLCTQVCISLLYPLLFITLNIVSDFRLKRVAWLRDQLVEYLDILITILLLFEFRLHHCKDYHFISLERPVEDVDVTVLVGPSKQAMFVARTADGTAVSDEQSTESRTRRPLSSLALDNNEPPGDVDALPIDF